MFSVYIRCRSCEESEGFIWDGLDEIKNHSCKFCSEKERITSVKEYTFEEAFLDRDNDRIDFKNKNSKDALCKDVIYYYDRNTCNIYCYLKGGEKTQDNTLTKSNLKLNALSIFNLTKETFIKVEEEKEEPKENGLGLKQDSLSFFHEVYDTKAETDIANAIEIYKQLLRHPLVVKIVDSMDQYSLILASTTEIIVGDWYRNIGKLTQISPFFRTPEDAQQAIKDIGEDNLIFMFKTFKGVE